MPLPRVRFTVRRLMVAVAIVAMAAAATAEFLNNRGLRKQIRLQESRAAYWSEQARRAGPSTVHGDGARKVADMFLERARIYREAERTGRPPGPMPPWPVDDFAPGPPESE